MSVGARLRRTGEQVQEVVRRHRPDYQILLFMGILMLLGLVVMYAIGPQRANVLNAGLGSEGYSDTYFFIRQLISIGMALAAFVFMAVVPYQTILKYSRLLLFVGIGACVLLAFAALIGWGIAQESYGATRWFDFGIISVQPAEILKFGVLLYLGAFLGRQVQKGKLNDVQETLLPAGIIVAIAALLIVVVQRDLGTGISLLAIVGSMLFVGGINKRVGAILGIIVLISGVFLIMSAPHRMARVATFFQGDTTTTDDPGAYHIEHAKIAIGSGGVFGVGIGNSVQATGYLPEAINDSVFAIMGEIFGFVGLLAVLFLFVALLMRLLRVMDHLVDMRMKLIAAGVFGWFGAHVVLNIGAMIGIVPLTGITLPLLSFGGTSMLFIAAALGLVFQFSRYTVHRPHVKEEDDEDSRSRRGVGRTRYASRRSV